MMIVFLIAVFIIFVTVGGLILALSVIARVKRKSDAEEDEQIKVLVKIKMAVFHRLESECPYCKMQVQAPPPEPAGDEWRHPQGFDCPACARRIVIRRSETGQLFFRA